jgi:hypothetical protein
MNVAKEGVTVYAHGSEQCLRRCCLQYLNIFEHSMICARCRWCAGCFIGYLRTSDFGGRWALLLGTSPEGMALHLFAHADVAERTTKQAYMGWLRDAVVFYKRSQKPDRGDGTYDTLVKLLLVGDEMVGKSVFLYRWADDVFVEQYIPTIGIDFKMRHIQIGLMTVKVRFVSFSLCSLLTERSYAATVMGRAR